MQEIKKIRFVNTEILDKIVLSFLPLDKQVQFKKEDLEKIIDVLEEEVILKKAKEIQDSRNKKSIS